LNAVITVAVVALIAASGQAFAQTRTETLEHIDDLGRRNEKLQERIRMLEQDNAALRARLRQLEASEPIPAPVAPQPAPIPQGPRLEEPRPAARTAPMPSPVAPQPAPIPQGPRLEEPGPAARTSPMPSPAAGAPAVSFNGTIDLDSEPPGAQVATSLGSGCETPCAVEIFADGPFTVTFTHPGYAPTTVNVRLQPGQPGVSDPKFSPNPVFVQLTPQTKKKPAVSGPLKLNPAR
jgi:PEGA domain